MRIEIKHNKLNDLFLRIFVAGIAKALCNYDFLVKNKNLLFFN